MQTPEVVQEAVGLARTSRTNRDPLVFHLFCVNPISDFLPCPCVQIPGPGSPQPHGQSLRAQLSVNASSLDQPIGSMSLDYPVDTASPRRLRSHIHFSFHDTYVMLVAAENVYRTVDNA